MTVNWELVWSSLGPILMGAVTGTIPVALASFGLGLLLALLVVIRSSPRLPASTSR